MYEFKRSFISNLSNVRVILHDILLFLSNSIPNISSESKAELKLIFSELLCNAVIHGNKNDNNKYVMLYIRINNNKVYSEIKDEGRGFDYLNLLKDFNNNRETFRENGRGLWIVDSLSDSLTFNASGNGIKFIKKVRI